MSGRECPMCCGKGILEATYSDRIRDLRKQHGITQEELAKHLGISRASLANIESDRQSVSPFTLIALANYFNVTVDWLLGRPSNPSGE
jgi:transcriptional regulator with XRE-family HTH domain